MLQIESILKSKKITSKELAEKTGLTKATISSIINNKSSPKVDTLLLIAEALNVPVESFFSKNSETIHVIINNNLKTFYSLDEFKVFANNQ